MNPLQSFLNNLKSKSKTTPFSVRKPEMQDPYKNNPVSTTNKPITTSNVGATTTKPTTITPPKIQSTLPASGKAFVQNQVNFPTAPETFTPSGTITQTAPVESKQTPVSTSKDAYISAYKKYIDSLNQSKDVAEAKTAYNDYVANMAKSKAGLEGQGRGIPLNIVRGQQEKLLGQTQPEAQRLLGEIEIAQGADKLAQERAKTGVELEKSLLDLDKEDKPIEIDGQLYQKQEDGSYKVVAGEKKAEKLSTSITDIGGRRVLVDTQTGATIRDLGASPKTSSSGGSDLSDLLSIAEAKALGVPYGTTKAQAVGKRALSPVQQQTAVSAGSALGALKNLENMITNEEGGFDEKKLLNFGLGELATYEREIKDVISRIRTGAALTSSEESFYGKQIPTWKDTDETIQAKINQLSAFYAGIAGSPITLQTADGEVLVAEDMYDPETRREVRDLITNGANVIQY